MKANPATAVTAQHICLEVEADQRAGAVHQVEGGAEARDPGQVAGVAEQHRRSVLLRGILLNGLSGVPGNQALGQNAVKLCGFQGVAQ